MVKMEIEKIRQRLGRENVWNTLHT